MKHLETPPKLKPGERILLCGATGSGKTEWARWYATRVPQHVIAIDPKASLSRDVKTSWSATLKSLGENRLTVYAPPRGYGPREIDALIGDLHDTMTNVCLWLDEAYALHSRGQAGDGLIAWITRGRGLRQSLIACTQRPAWISQMLISESEYVMTGDLRLPQDRKKLVDSTGSPVFYGAGALARYEFLAYDVRKNASGKFRLRFGT